MFRAQPITITSPRKSFLPGCIVKDSYDLFPFFKALEKSPNKLYDGFLIPV